MCQSGARGNPPPDTGGAGPGQSQGCEARRPWAGSPEMRDLALKMRQDGASHGQIAKAPNQPRSQQTVVIETISEGLARQH